MKECSKCSNIKSLESFFKRKSSKDGLEGVCKECRQEKRKPYLKDLNVKSNIKRKNNGYFREYTKERRNNDNLYNVTCQLRKIISRSLTNKKSRTHEILGCSFEDFKKYIESKFDNWMTWENKGLYNGYFNYGWDIDHIIPLSSARNEEDLIKLNHYSNLQPLCSKVNRDIKKDNLNW